MPLWNFAKKLAEKTEKRKFDIVKRLVIEGGKFDNIRISAQIYTDLKDFERVGHIVKEICDSFK